VIHLPCPESTMRSSQHVRQALRIVRDKCSARLTFDAEFSAERRPDDDLPPTRPDVVDRNPSASARQTPMLLDLALRFANHSVIQTPIGRQQKNPRDDRSRISPVTCDARRTG